MVGNNQKPFGELNIGTPPIAIFPLFYTFQFCAYYVRKCFIIKLLSFHHFNGLSMSVDNGYVRMSSCWQLCYALERRGRMSLGQTLFEFLLPRTQGQHMLPSSDAVSGSPGRSAEGCAFLTLFQTLIILLRFWNQAKLPDWVKWRQTCPGSVFHPRSSERMTVSGCQLVKFYTSQPGLNSWQSPDSEVYPMDGWRSLLLIRTWK